MKKIFKAITDYQKVQFSTFDFSNNYTGSVNDFGSLNMIYGTTVLPGDTWKLSHNFMCKLPPLVAPAFTRIKGIINTFFVKYSSIWKYWNSFISDRPEDVFLSRSAAAAYRGKFVEPRIPMPFIALICKIAKGWVNVSNSPSEPGKMYMKLYSATSGFQFTSVPYALAWSVSSIYANSRQVTFTSNVTQLLNDGEIALDAVTSSNDLIFDVYQFLGTVFTNFTNVVGNSVINYCVRLGFADAESMIVYCCQQCCRVLENMGIPTDLIARSSISTYSEDFFNALPLMAVSSAWHEYFRSEQNQAPEFDFREVNGSVAPLSTWTLSDGSHPFSGSITGNQSPHGWWLKLNGIPPSVSSQSDYWYRITTFEEVFSLLTGAFLDVVLLGQKAALFSNTVENVNILPTFYNGLIFMRYRNFEDDFFTSASVDPNNGGVSVNVPGTIDALRTASKFEEFLERGIARDFRTWLDMQFGEKPSEDYQPPLLLGTQVCPIQIGEQLQTSETTSASPLGERAGIADGYSNSGTANHRCNEHGFIFSLLSFVIDSQYKDGIAREFLTHKQLDYPFPAFANLGAETISVKEIYYGDSFQYHSLADNTGNPVVINHGSGSNYDTIQSSPDDLSRTYPDTTQGLGVDVTLSPYATSTRAFISDDEPFRFSANQDVFGYTPRFSRWKFKGDVVAGQMRESLDYWHTFREFFQRPYIGHNFVSYLNASFINNINRIFAYVNDNVDKFYIYCFNNASVRRCLPLIPDTTLD